MKIFLTQIILVVLLSAINIRAQTNAGVATNFSAKIEVFPTAWQRTNSTEVDALSNYEERIKAADEFSEKMQAIQDAGDADMLLAGAQEMTNRWPKDARGWVFLGDAHSLKGQTAQAQVDFKYAIELNLTNGAAWTYLGLIEARSGEHERAIADLEVAVLLKPNCWVWMGLGVEHEATSNLLEATICFRKATKLNPTNEDSWLSLERVLLKQNNWDEAITAMKDALKIMPENEDLHMGLLGAYAKESDTEDWQSTVRDDLLNGREHSGKIGEMSSAIMELAKINPTNEICIAWSKYLDAKDQVAIARLAQQRTEQAERIAKSNSGTSNPSTSSNTKDNQGLWDDLKGLFATTVNGFNVQPVVSYMKAHCNDPKSLSIVGWSRVQALNGGCQGRVTFRAKNGFGALMLYTYSFTINADGIVGDFFESPQ